MSLAGNMWPRAVCFVNSRVAAEGGSARSLRFASKILAIDEGPRPGDRVIDLQGGFVLPGLINAHDHLELNHYGRLKMRERYANATEWIDDMRPRLKSDPHIRAGQAHSLGDRLFIGGLKNLLAGVTTVAHHNPFYRELRFRFPIRVVRRYGWAHSFVLERAPAGARGEAGGEVASRHRSTPRGAPFFVHLAEGVDEAARAELPRLEALGCVGANVVLVHGVAIDPKDWPGVAARGTGLVWCPASNLFLFARTVAVRQFLDSTPGPAQDRIALGTDSRLTGARDLLDEMRVASTAAAVSAHELLGMVTRSAAALLGRPAAGRIARGTDADLLVIPQLADTPASALLAAARRDVTLVVIGGRPLLGDPGLADVFTARNTPTRTLTLDGAPKIMHAGLVRRIRRCAIVEPGVQTV